MLVSITPNMCIQAGPHSRSAVDVRCTSCSLIIEVCCHSNGVCVKLPLCTTVCVLEAVLTAHLEELNVAEVEDGGKDAE